MYLFFDTETTGFARFDLPAADPQQPYVVQLAAILTEKDGTERSSMSVLITPFDPRTDERVYIPEQARDVHGISDMHTGLFGVKMETAAAMFKDMTHCATTYVAHNAKFDIITVNALLIRGLGFDETHMISEDHCYCTMEESKDIVKAPPTEKMIAVGRTHYKTPNLGEAYKHFTGKDLEGAHDAMVDVRACMEIFFALKEIDNG